MTMFPLGPIGPGRVPTGEPYVPRTPKEIADQETSDEAGPPEESRFTSAVERDYGTITSQNIEAMFVQSGADMDDPVVQAYLSQAVSDMKAADTETERQTKLQEIQLYLPQIAADRPAIPATQWGEALAQSNLEDPLRIPANHPRYQEATGNKPSKFIRDPDTGWVRFVGDVLVDPNVPIGTPGAVIFGPSSTAPGSPLWLQTVQTSWSPEKVAEWRKRLYDNGYLTKEQSKIKGAPDLAMLNALTQYHEIRYQNGGIPLTTDAAGVAGSGAEYNLTAKDYQVQIRNDVREQFRNNFGNDPSDAELENWTRFVTQSSLKAQRTMTKKGMDPGAAGSYASAKAGELLAERLYTSPQATQSRESIEENTSLRDGLTAAVVATRSLSG